ARGAAPRCRCARCDRERRPDRRRALLLRRPDRSGRAGAVAAGGPACRAAADRGDRLPRRAQPRGCALRRDGPDHRGAGHGGSRAADRMRLAGDASHPVSGAPPGRGHGGAARAGRDSLQRARRRMPRGPVAPQSRIAGAAVVDGVARGLGGAAQACTSPTVAQPRSPCGGRGDAYPLRGATAAAQPAHPLRPSALRVARILPAAVRMQRAGARSGGHDGEAGGRPGGEDDGSGVGWVGDRAGAQPPRGRTPDGRHLPILPPGLWPRPRHHAGPSRPRRAPRAGVVTLAVASGVVQRTGPLRPPTTSPLKGGRVRTSVRVATVLLVTLAALSCGRDEPLRPGGPSLSFVSADSVSPVTYVLDLDALVPPPFLDAQIQRAGGELTASLDKIGVAIATSSDPAFASRVAKLRGVRTVTEDTMVQWVPQDTEPTMVE